jgi:hypothetical protein
VNVRDRYYSAPLYHDEAIESGIFGHHVLLISHGANTDVNIGPVGFPVIYEVAQVLLGHGADVNARD